MSESKNYQGGIFCVIPIGKLYDESIAESVRWRLKKYLNATAKELKSENLNAWIQSAIEKVLNEEMQTQKYETYKSMKVSAPRGTSVGDKSYTDSEDRRRAAFRKLRDEVTNSYGYAIYHNGRRVSLQVAPFAAKYKRGESEERLRLFFEKKNDMPGIRPVSEHNKNNWQIVIAVAATIAARLESKTEYPDGLYRGFGKMVLLYWAQIIANTIRAKFGRVEAPVQYGYILSRQGYKGKVYRPII